GRAHRARRPARGLRGGRGGPARCQATSRGAAGVHSRAAAHRTVRGCRLSRRPERRRGRRHRPARPAVRPRRQGGVGGHLPLRRLRQGRGRPRDGDRPAGVGRRVVVADRRPGGVRRQLRGVEWHRDHRAVRRLRWHGGGRLVGPAGDSGVLDSARRSRRARERLGGDAVHRVRSAAPPARSCVAASSRAAGL
ncbi:MAG: Uncharacterized protein Q1 colocalized with Q, partial [uncultured Nocardioidaceae bacterium]